VLSVCIQFDRQVFCDPGEGNIGLHAPKLLEGGCGNFFLSGHAGGGGEHAVGADEIAALADAFARKPHRLVIVAAEELGVGGDAAIKRR